MRRSRRRRGKPQRHVSLSATDAEWAAVSANAARRGLSRARYLIGLVELDTGGADPARPMALAPDEQRALLEAVRAIHALLTEEPDRSVREESPAEDGTAAAPEAATLPPADPSPDTGHPAGSGNPRQERLF